MMYAVFILMGAAFLLNKLSQNYGLWNLNCRREITRRILEIDEEFDVSVIVENRKALPVTFLQIKEKMSGTLEYKHGTNSTRDMDYLYHESTMMIMPYQRIKRTYRLYPTKRGRYFFYDIGVNAGDLIGINFFSKEIPLMQEVVVLPRGVDLQETLMPYGDYNGDISVRRWIIEDPVLMLGIREYTGFEPQKNIHWPTSLRTGRLMVKNFDYTSDNKVVVNLNIEAYKPFWMNIDGGKIERCISLSRTIVEEFENEGIPYGFTTNAQMGGSNLNGSYTGLGPSHLNTILEALGSIDYGITKGFEEHLLELGGRDQRFTTHVIITPTVFEEYVEYINLLGRKCERLIVITLSDNNLNLLNPGILSFVERGDNN